MKPLTVAPWRLGLPHHEWRQYQYEAYLDALRALSEQRFVIMEAPVGIGKTAIASALSDGLETTVLVQNLGLLEQYRDYGFAVLMGRQAYPCGLKSKLSSWKEKYDRVPTAADCHYIHNMFHCPAHERCPYFLAREEAYASPRMACTYKYAAVSERLQKREGLIVLDEVHNSVRELLSIDSCVITDTERKREKYPLFLLADFGTNGDGDVLDAEGRAKLIEWVEKCMPFVAQVDLFDTLSPTGTEKRKAFNKLTSLLTLLHNISIDLFYKCKKRDVYSKKSGRVRQEYIMEVKALSPARTFARITESKENVFLMSATIGSPRDLICNEFKIDSFHYKSWPHPVPPSRRPIYNIAHRAMTYGNLKRDFTLYQQQADWITRWINDFTEDEWRGIVLTTSYAKVKQLKRYMPSGLKKPHYVFKSDVRGSGLQNRISTFMNDETKGAIQVDTIQGWGTGVDLRGDIARFVVVAGVPLSNPADRFDSIRFSTPEGRAYAYAYAYNGVMQATGRVTRGEKGDEGEYTLNCGALADMMATSPKALQFYSKWFKDAIV